MLSELLVKRPDGSKVLALRVDPQSHWMYTHTATGEETS